MPPHHVLYHMYVANSINSTQPAILQLQFYLIFLTFYFDITKKKNSDGGRGVGISKFKFTRAGGMGWRGGEGRGVV